MMDCKIDIRGVQNGEHLYSVHLDQAFFDSYGSELIVGADLNVDYTLKKSGDWMGIEMKIQGEVLTECDRCLGNLPFPINLEKSFSVKFFGSIEENEFGEDVIALHQSETSLDTGQIVYDFVSLEIPIKKVHSEGECDPIVMNKLKEITT